MAELRLERLTPPHIGLLGAVAAAGGRRVTAALVGGAVRDAWLGRPLSQDIDVAVPAGAVDLARRVADRLAGAFVLLDAERGAARVLALGRQLDLTDFRAPTLEGDLAARDYTVNALAVPLGALLRRGRAPIVDPTGGLADLRARRLRPPSRGALADDPLRALRGVRLELALGLRLTPGAARAVAAVAPALAAVSAERIRDELIALLALPETARALRRADRLGPLAGGLPEGERTAGPPPAAPPRVPPAPAPARPAAAPPPLAGR